MKTPKRDYELTTMEHSCMERTWDFAQEQVSAQRWKRKNKLKQLKRTISKLNEEKRHLLRVLKLSTLCQIEEADKASIDWCMKHLTIDTFEAKWEMENGMLIRSGIPPIIRWDGKEL